MANIILSGQDHISTAILDFWDPKGNDPKIEVLDAIHQKITRSSIPGSFKIFWGLRENWWKQMIDGRFHELGPEVFDKGLHGAKKEPNYLKGTCKASLFASQHLNRLPTVQFYKDLHKTACQYFDDKYANVNSDEVGKFNRAYNCEGTCYDLFPELTDDQLLSLYESSKIAKDFEGIYEISDFGGFTPEMLNGHDQQTVLNMVNAARDETDAFRRKIFDKIDAVNREIEEQSKRLELPQIAEVCLDEWYFPWKIEVNYFCENVEQAVETLLLRFAKKMVAAKNQDVKLKLIAELFQVLEWIHPFPDGQGRTDLILLSKLLTEHGFNPAILKMPYYSTYHLRSEWIEYLKAGMGEWQKEAASVIESKMGKCVVS